jgi:ribonuclease HII
MPKPKQNNINLTEYETMFLQPAGIDEAGRGALAGPVYAAALTANVDDLKQIKVKDSKQLTPKSRDELFAQIQCSSISFGIGIVGNEEIDKINILKATMLAMKQAVLALPQRPDGLLVDGNYFTGFGIPFVTIVKGDSKVALISAASIIAKVSRDRWMTEIAHVQYPEYGFDRHKGYGTGSHIAAILKHGPCPLHRLSFLNNILNKPQTLFDEIINIKHNK